MRHPLHLDDVFQADRATMKWTEGTPILTHPVKRIGFFQGSFFVNERPRCDLLVRVDSIETMLCPLPSG